MTVGSLVEAAGDHRRPRVPVGQAIPVCGIVRRTAATARQTLACRRVREAHRGRGERSAPVVPSMRSARDAKTSRPGCTANPAIRTRCSAAANSSRSTTPVSRVVPTLSGPLLTTSVSPDQASAAPSAAIASNRSAGCSAAIPDERSEDAPPRRRSVSVEDGLPQALSVRARRARRRAHAPVD
jgi:hypothetical protein